MKNLIKKMTFACSRKREFLIRVFFCVCLLCACKNTRLRCKHSSLLSQIGVQQLIYSHFSSCQLVVFLSLYLFITAFIQCQSNKKKIIVSQEHVALCLVLFFHCMGNCEQQTHKIIQSTTFLPTLWW